MNTATLPRCPSCHEILFVGSKLFIDWSCLQVGFSNSSVRMRFYSPLVKWKWSSRHPFPSLGGGDNLILQSVDINCFYGSVGDVYLPGQMEFQSIGPGRRHARIDDKLLRVSLIVNADG